MANAEAVTSIFQITTSSGAILLIAWLIRTWPIWKQRLNEARQIEVAAGEKFRDQLLQRITELEQAAANSASNFQTQLTGALDLERRRCDAVMEEMRLDFKQRLKQLMDQFLAFQAAMARGVPLGPRSPEMDKALVDLANIAGAEVPPELRKSEE